MSEEKQNKKEYKGLAGMLHGVRWSQHVLSVLSEVFILIAFAISGMDVSLSGKLTNLGWMPYLWAGIFALGIDSAFVISWVRVRQCYTNPGRKGMWWNLLLAIGMSFIVFQPVAIQLLQQSMGLSFTAAITNLGININFLTYARATVAVILGAVLALTNVESEHPEQSAPVQKVKRLYPWTRAFEHFAPPIIEQSTPVQIEQVTGAQNAEIEQPVSAQIEQPAGAQKEKIEQVKSVQIEQPKSAQSPAQLNRKKQQNKRSNSLRLVAKDTPFERVKKVLNDTPDCSDSELARRSNVARGTAKKHRIAIESEQEELLNLSSR